MESSPFVFKDANGKEYISTPEIDVMSSVFWLFMIGATSTMWISFAFIMAGGH